MNISNEVETLIKNNYKGSFLSLEDDVAKIFSVKRTLKKNIIHDTLKDNEKNVKLLLNNIKFLHNLFDEKVLSEIFNEILDDSEKWHYKSIIYFLGKGDGEHDVRFYSMLVELG